MKHQPSNKKTVVRIIAILIAIYFIYSYKDFKKGFIDGYTAYNEVKTKKAYNTTSQEDYRFITLFKM